MHLTLVAGHEQSDNVPEKKRDASEQGKGCGDVLTDVVFVQNARGTHEDVTAGESYHGDGKKDAEIKAEEDAANDEPECTHAEYAEKGSEEGEILPREKDDGGEPSEDTAGRDGGRQYDVGRASAECKVQERYENEGLRADIDGEAYVLRAQGGGGMRPSVGDGADDHE